MLWKKTPSHRPDRIFLQMISRSLRRFIIPAGFAVFIAFSLGGCGGGDDTPTPTPSPIRTAEPLESATPTPPPPASDYRLIYREAGAKEDIIWRAQPADPTQREEVVRIAHREGFPVVASLSPDARLLAYLSLPDSAQSASSSQADAMVYDLARKETTKIAGGIDYQFRPVWSPDGQLLYMRRYAGSEILSADVSLVYTRVLRLPRPDEPTPPPTPRPTPTPEPTPLPPGFVPTPTPTPEDPIKVMFKARYSQVISWTPLGFDRDGKSMFFLQVNGGLQGTTVVGLVAPATLSAIEETRGQWEAQVKQIMQLFPPPPPDATPPPPDAPPTPSIPPSPTPAAKLVVQLTDQTAEDFAISPDSTRLAFRVSAIIDGKFVTRLYLADLIAATVAPLATEGLPQIDHTGVAWHPDGQGLAIGLIPPEGGVGAAAIAPIGGGPGTLLTQLESGFDVPRNYSPDGVWLAITHFSGDSPANPGEASLDLLSTVGNRIRVGAGDTYATTDAIIGWVKVEPPPSPAPSP